jgi:hypothetical protein
MTKTGTNKIVAGTFKDDRTPSQCQNLTNYIMGYDTFMSNFDNMGDGLRSYAVWACKQSHGDKVFKWVKSRSDMKYVSYRSLNSIKKYMGNNVHIHIYAVGDNHPAVTSK